ncbi:MFS transporter [Streptomyces luteogriseus]|uniref:MFS transporter n=1 Tax=Streptomyces TaxID=1883 RepID=UPI00068C612A|nr:MFS transporter [Streptomyces sp. NRRL S-475]
MLKRGLSALKGAVPEAPPVRTFLGIVLVLTLGQGLWMALNAVYATTVLGLSPGQFGVGVGVAAGVALALSTPAGHLADRIGPRRVQMWSLVAMAPLSAALLLVSGYSAYLVVISVQAVAYSTSRSARLAMIAGIAPPDQRVAVRAYVRTVSNVSATVGAALAGVLLTVGSETAYRSAVLVVAFAYLASGLLTLRLPAVSPRPAKPGPALTVLRDRPFLAFVVLDGLLSMHNLLLEVVLPLWVLHRTGAPRWVIAGLLLLNTVLVVVLQVRASRGTDEPGPAARAARGGALCIAVACVIFSLTEGVSAVTASVLLFLGAIAHVLGEVRQAAGSWGISFGLAPEDAQGQYQGTASMGADIGRMIAPAVLTWLAIEYGTFGWLVMAVGFAAVGAALPPVVAWAARRRTERAVPTSA